MPRLNVPASVVVWVLHQGSRMCVPLQFEWHAQEQISTLPVRPCCSYSDSTWQAAHPCNRYSALQGAGYGEQEKRGDRRLASLVSSQFPPLAISPVLLNKDAAV